MRLSKKSLIEFKLNNGKYYISSLENFWSFVLRLSGEQPFGNQIQKYGISLFNGDAFVPLLSIEFFREDPASRKVQIEGNHIALLGDSRFIKPAPFVKLPELDMSYLSDDKKDLLKDFLFIKGLLDLDDITIVKKQIAIANSLHIRDHLLLYKDSLFDLLPVSNPLEYPFYENTVENVQFYLETSDEDLVRIAKESTRRNSRIPFFILQLPWEFQEFYLKGLTDPESNNILKRSVPFVGELGYILDQQEKSYSLRVIYTEEDRQFVEVSLGRLHPDYEEEYKISADFCREGFDIKVEGNRILADGYIQED